MEAVAGLDAADMNLYATAARYRLGQVEGGDGGRKIFEAAEKWLRRQGVRAPARFVAMLAPGWD